MTRYQVDSEQVQLATQSAQGTMGRIRSEVASLLAQLSGLQGSWTGQAASAFQAAVDDWRLTQQHVEESLSSLSQALGAAGVHYADAEQANARLFLR